MAPVSTLSFNTALVTGGSGGLGLAMAKELIKLNKNVILAGRSEDKLIAAAKEIGAKDYFTIDVGNTASIPEFIKTVTSKHPEIDCLINNAGVQRPFQVMGPDYDFDLSKADQEIDINIRGPLHLSIGFVEHFNKKENGAVIMNVSSVLGFVPFSLVNPVYNGTKSWVHFFTTNLRTQLDKAGSKIKVVEIVPPSVETDLHRERKDPDDNKRAKGNKVSLTQDEFIKEVSEGWHKDLDTVTAGPGHDIVNAWNESMGTKYTKAIK